jgi:hypothetical protein
MVLSQLGRPFKLIDLDEQLMTMIEALRKVIRRMHHQAIKRIVRPMLGFKRFQCAKILVAEIETMHIETMHIETMHMIRKGQLRRAHTQAWSAASSSSGYGVRETVDPSERIGYVALQCLLLV